MGPQAPEFIPPPVISDKPTGASGPPDVPIQAPLDPEQEATLLQMQAMAARAEAQKMQETAANPQETPPNLDLTGEQAENARKIIEQMSQSASTPPSPAETSLPSQSPAVPIKENKSIFATVLQGIKKILSAPKQAWVWTKSQVNAFVGRINTTLFGPPQSPKQTA